MKFELTILGCNSAKAANGRHPTAQVLTIKEHLILIDCGEGTQMQMDKFHIRRGRINHIFISHLHGDHIFGLPGLLTSYSLNGRKKPMTIFSPKGLEEMLTVILRNSGSMLSHPIHYVEVDTTQSYSVYENDFMEVSSIPLDHRVPTSGYLFREKARPRNMIAEQIEIHQIPYPQIKAIKAGADFTKPDGSVISNTALTTDPPRTRSYAFCSDTMYTESIVPIIKNVDLLYHEATYLHEKVERAKTTKHSTALQAAQIAQQASAGQLILGHFSSRYADASPLQAEAASVFANSVVAEEGMRYEILRDEG